MLADAQLEGPADPDAPVDALPPLVTVRVPVAAPETLAEREVADAVAHERVAVALPPLGEAVEGSDAVAETVADAEKLATLESLQHADGEGDVDPDFVTVGETDGDGDCEEDRDVDVEPVLVLELNVDREALVECVDCPDADADAVVHADPELVGLKLELREGEADADAEREVLSDSVETDDADDETDSDVDAVSDEDTDDDAVSEGEPVAIADAVPVVELVAEFERDLEFVRDTTTVAVEHPEGEVVLDGSRETELVRVRTDWSEPAAKFVELGSDDADDESDAADVALGESDGEAVAELDAVCDGDGDVVLLSGADRVAVSVALGDMLAVRPTDAVADAVATARTVARVDAVGLVEVDAECVPPDTVTGAEADREPTALRDIETVTETEELDRAERDSDVDDDELREIVGLAVPEPVTLGDREPLDDDELVRDPDGLAVGEGPGPSVALPLALRDGDTDERCVRDATAPTLTLLLPVGLALTHALSERLVEGVAESEPLTEELEEGELEEDSEDEDEDEPVRAAVSVAVDERDRRTEALELLPMDRVTETVSVGESVESALPVLEDEGVAVPRGDLDAEGLADGELELESVGVALVELVGDPESDTAAVDDPEPLVDDVADDDAEMVADREGVEDSVDVEESVARATGLAVLVPHGLGVELLVELSEGRGERLAPLLRVPEAEPVGATVVEGLFVSDGEPVADTDEHAEPVGVRDVRAELDSDPVDVDVRLGRGDSDAHDVAELVPEVRGEREPLGDAEAERDIEDDAVGEGVCELLTVAEPDREADTDIVGEPVDEPEPETLPEIVGDKDDVIVGDPLPDKLGLCDAERERELEALTVPLAVPLGVLLLTPENVAVRDATALRKGVDVDDGLDVIVPDCDGDEDVERLREGDALVDAHAERDDDDDAEPLARCDAAGDDELLEDPVRDGLVVLLRDAAPVRDADGVVDGRLDADGLALSVRHAVLVSEAVRDANRERVPVELELEEGVALGEPDALGDLVVARDGLNDADLVDVADTVSVALTVNVPDPELDRDATAVDVLLPVLLAVIRLVRVVVDVAEWHMLPVDDGDALLLPEADAQNDTEADAVDVEVTVAVGVAVGLPDIKRLGDDVDDRDWLGDPVAVFDEDEEAVAEDDAGADAALPTRSVCSSRINTTRLTLTPPPPLIRTRPTRLIHDEEARASVSERTDTDTDKGTISPS